MLQTIRDRATGWIAYVIIGLLIIPFALWGINQYFSGSETLEAAKIGDSSISLQEFQRAYQQQRLRLQSLLGEKFDSAVPEEGLLKQQVLQSLINERLLTQAADKLSLRVSDQQLTQAIQSFEVFHQDGAFSRELYDRVLRAQGYSKALFEAGLRHSLVIDQLQDGLASSAIVTATELDKSIHLLNQQRELEYIILSLANSLVKTTVDEAAIQTYYQENKDRLLSPEQVQVNYVELKLEQMAEAIAVSDVELQAAYQEQIAKYSQPEERSASHILITIPPGVSGEELDKARAQAQTLYKDIASGNKSFQQLIEEIKAADGKAMQAGELGVIRKGMMDPAFESALFGLKAAGDTSEPVQTSFGFHIIRLDGIIPERVKSFAEVRDEVARELRLQQAEARFYEATETLANLSHEHPDSLEPAASSLKLTIQESPWFTRQGGEGIAAYPKVIESAFSDNVLTRGFNSEPIEVEPNHIIILRVQAHKEAAPRSLEEARAEIANQLRDNRARDALKTDTEALLKRAGQGETLESLASEFGGEFKKTELVGRTSTSLDGALLAEAFQLAKPEDGKVSLGTAELTNGDRAVVSVKRVAPGRVEDFQEAQRKALNQRLIEQTGAAQFEGFLADLRSQTEVVVYSDRL